MNESMKKLIEIMDLNTILNMYIDPIKNGITFLTNDILILTTFIIMRVTQRLKGTNFSKIES